MVKGFDRSLGSVVGLGPQGGEETGQTWREGGGEMRCVQPVVVEAVGGGNPQIPLSVPYPTPGASLVTQMVKNLSAVQEKRVASLDQEDPLEKGMTTHSSVLAWRIPGTGEPGGLPSVGSHRLSSLAAATKGKEAGKLGRRN